MICHLYNQVLFKELHFTTSPSERVMVPFDLLRKSLSLYIRMCIHKAADSREGGANEEEEAWFVEEVMGVLRWSKEVLLPAFSDNLQ